MRSQQALSSMTKGGKIARNPCYVARTKKGVLAWQEEEVIYFIIGL